jgi:phosphoglycerol transferase MdoB-like AlkP superfamily enzyme
MSPFLVGLIVLFSLTAIFYIVLFSFIFYWHLKKITFILLPILFIFEYFVMGFLMVSLVSIILNYLPVIVVAAGL